MAMLLVELIDSLISWMPKMSLFALISTFIILPVWMSNLKNNFTQGSSIIFEEYFYDQGFHHVTLAEDVDITGK